MVYEKVNPYTWVIGKNKGVTKERYAKSLAASQELATAKKGLNIRRTQEYKEFCKEVFQDKSFICLKEFRQLIGQHIHKNNHTWYVERMKDLGLITEKHKVIKPGDNL